MANARRFLPCFSDKNEVETYKFELYSETATIQELKEYIEDVEHKYKAEKNYTLGRNQYYFNEIITQIPKNVDGGYRGGRRAKVN